MLQRFIMQDTNERVTTVYIVYGLTKTQGEDLTEQLFYVCFGCTALALEELIKLGITRHTTDYKVTDRELSIYNISEIRRNFTVTRKQFKVANKWPL